MATEELVTEQFQFLGIEVTKEVLTKCLSICIEYNVDAETFIEQWMAFSLTTLNGASPTLDNLELLEKREFSKRSSSRSNALVNEVAHSSTGTSLTVYGVPDSKHKVLTIRSENEVLSNYITTAAKRIKIEPSVPSTNQNELHPATYSPKVEHSVKYTSRTNQGTVVHSFGDEKLLEVLANPIMLNLLDLNITQVPNDDGELYTKATFGFELLHEKASIFDNHIRYLSQCIMKKNGFSETSSVRHKTQSEVLVAGRIECDADARLNSKSVVLQGTWEESLSQVVPVDLDGLQQYSLFPGQVVVLRGINPRGNQFIPQEVYCDASRPLTHHAPDNMQTLTDTLSMVIAAGPYTTNNNMSYEPLKDFITYINTHRPHVVIMTGPFMDCEHPKVKDNSMADTYKSLFDKLVDSIGEISNLSPFTKIYIVSSHKDAFHVNIYPSPPYSSRRKHTNIHFLPDPCTLSINGYLIGVTSSDVLMTINQEEISFGTGGDKLSRLSSHVLRQQCYWPVAGAGAGGARAGLGGAVGGVGGAAGGPGGVGAAAGGVALDGALWAAHAQLPAAPHVLVLPSNFRYFVKDVNGCVVINPEHLSKGAGAGTFARLRISQSTDTQGKNNIAAQIVRI